MSDCTDDILHQPDSATVCHCKNISKGMFQELIGQGVLDLDELRRRTGSDGQHCAERSPKGRCCTPEIVRLLRHAKGMLPMT